MTMFQAGGKGKLCTTELGSRLMLFCIFIHDLDEGLENMCIRFTANINVECEVEDSNSI